MTALKKEQEISTKLSVETDTIGEYVVLYQQQRAIMQSRMTAKDDYIRRCTLEINTLNRTVAELQARVVVPTHIPAVAERSAQLTELSQPPHHMQPARHSKPHSHTGGPQWWIHGCAGCDGSIIHI